MQVHDTEDAAAELSRHFDAIAAFVNGARLRGGVVYCHCGAGISRGPTCVIASLIRAQRLTYDSGSGRQRAPVRRGERDRGVVPIGFREALQLHQAIFCGVVCLVRGLIVCCLLG